jgi:prepilin-type N-terminal cleavage/methylation domain-containing protein
MQSIITLINNQNKSTDSAGFTAVEMMVTTAVIALFVIGFFQTYLLLESQRVDIARQAVASDTAYSNLRQVTTRPNITCTDTMDLTTGSASSKEQSGGVDVPSFVPDSSVVVNGIQASNQKLKAFAPNGCAEYDNNPIKIVSTVTYSNGKKVIHSAYVN